jgi:DNA-binding LacI/PurR family transcriptional regulator
MPRKPSPGANLAKIAQSLGISVSTASRALRNADGIHPETRRLVLNKAGELGYVLPGLQGPDIKARPHQILALATEIAPGTDQGFLTGMSRASIAMNLAVLSHHVAPEDASSVLDHERQPVAMRAGMVDGIALIHYWPREIAAKLAERFPTVSVVHHYPDAEIDLIGVDDRAAAAALFRHFLQGGHKKIGFFGFCPEVSWSRSRFAAYVENLAAVGISYEEKNVCPIGLDAALAYKEFSDTGWGSRVLQRYKQGVDAWICPSATTSLTLVEFFRSKGLKIPKDVAIANSSQLPTNGQPVTSMHFSNEAIGAAALRRLVNRLQNPRELARVILLPPEFKMGETTRTPRRK